MKDEKKKNEIEVVEENISHKYQNIGMSLGMCFGVAIGMSFGELIYHNISIGMCMGLSIGMCLGMAIGAAKDKRIRENMLIVKDIVEEDFGCEGRPDGKEAMVTIVVEDKEGNLQNIQMSDKLVYQRKIEVGDQAFLETDGTLDLINEKK